MSTISSTTQTAGLCQDGLRPPGRRAQEHDKNLLTSSLSDPANYATTFGGAAYEALTAFDFETDGSIASGNTAQTANQIATSAQYMTRYDDEQEAEDAELLEYCGEFIGSMDGVEEPAIDVQDLRFRARRLCASMPTR